MTAPFVVVPVVEGHGEVGAVPVLLRRIGAVLEPERHIDVRLPVRGHRSKLSGPAEAERYLALAMNKLGGDNGAILVLIDADDDCAATVGPELLSACRAVRADVPVSVVLAVTEFEAWFLASAESLRGRRGLAADLAAPHGPEGIRNAKCWLQDRRIDGLAYSPTTDQPALTAIFDMEAARSSSASFDKLWRDVERLMDETP